MEQEELPDPARDRALGMSRDISRRDFLNGIAIGVGGVLASTWLPSLPALPRSAKYSGDSVLGPQDAPGYYPPALSGMRGSHPGSYEVAHAVRDGTFWSGAGQPIEGVGWELFAIAAVVVGGTSLMGGTGSVGTTLAGAILLGLIFNILNFENGLGWISLSAYWQSVVRGLFLLVVVVIQARLLARQAEA